MIELVSYLESLGADCKNIKAIKCPYHDDRTPSAGIYKGQDEKYRFRCHTCNITEDYMGLYFRDNGRYPEQEQKKEKSWSMAELEEWSGREAIYKYTDSFLVLRYRKSGKKIFHQFVKRGSRWFFGVPTPRPFYGCTDKDTLVCVEGEKCVDAMSWVGVDAFCAVGGAGGVNTANWRAIKGKRIILWPDNDDTGRQYMETVAKKLTDSGNDVAIYDKAHLLVDEKGDVADLIKKMHSEGMPKEDIAKEVRAELEAVAWPKKDQYLRDYVSKLQSGALRTLESDWPLLDITKYTQGGTLTAFCGAGGAGKTFWVHQLCARAIEAGWKVSNLQLEEDVEYHLARVHTQRTGGKSKIADVDNFTQQDLDAFIQDSDYLDKYRQTMTVADGLMSVDGMLSWVDEQAKAGSELIVIDPISVLDKGDRADRTDLMLVNRLKTIAKESDTRIIATVHPAKGKATDGGMDALSGGAAWQRLAQCILWLDVVDSQQIEIVDRDGIEALEYINRKIVMLKGRNAGPMKSNAIYFSFAGTTFTELGYKR